MENQGEKPRSKENNICSESTFWKLIFHAKLRPLFYLFIYLFVPVVILIVRRWIL